MQIGKLKFNSTAPGYNKQILSFFIKLFILVSVWFVCYNLILMPGRIIDRPVTNFISAAVVKCINFISPSTPTISRIESADKPSCYLVQNGKQVFGIWDVCNGIDLMFIYVGIVVLLPYPARRKIIFSIGGIIAIVLANIIRICSLYLIYVHYKSAFDFSHHYLFTLIMYVVIFYGWLLYTKKELTNG